MCLRVGTKSYAGCTVLHFWPKEPVRVLFLCDWHWEEMQKPVPGLHKPEGASEDWRPSIDEVLRQGIMRVNWAQRNQQEPFVAGFMPALSRQAKYTPAQQEQVLRLREFNQAYQ